MAEPCQNDGRHHEDHDRLIRLEQKLDALQQLTGDRWLAHGRVHDAEGKALELALTGSRRLTAIAFAVLGLIVPLGIGIVTVIVVRH